MRTTNKLFWVLWSLAQVAIITSCVYDVIMNKYIDDALFAFIVCQPLMALLPFFFKRHQLGAVTNIAIASIYAIYCCCERFNSGGGFLDGAAQIVQYIPFHALGHKIAFLLRFKQKMGGIDSSPSTTARSTGPIGERTVYRLVGTQSTNHFFYGSLCQLFLFTG